MARALPPQHRARTWSFATAIMMALCGVMTLLVSYFTCRSSPLLDRKDPRFCSKVGKMPTGVFIGVLSSFSLPSPASHLIKLVVDLFADTFLVVFAFTLFRSIPLPRFEKNLVLLVFSGSILTVLSVLVWVFLIYGPFNHGADTVMMAGMLRNFEVSISLRYRKPRNGLSIDTLIVDFSFPPFLQSLHLLDSNHSTTKVASTPFSWILQSCRIQSVEHDL